jgi:hypothetical protein
VKEEKIEISGKVLDDLKCFLLSREFDIYCEEENFGVLKEVFEFIFKRKPGGDM